MTEKALMELIRQLGQLHIEGNIVPPSWYQHLKYPSGKPYHIAITLLSEIVYWFRPRMVRDEHTGEFVGWSKKFKGDGIQRSYAAWGAPFGFTKREAADAIKYLVAEGIITTEIRDVTLSDGTLRPNVVVVTGVDPEFLRRITYNARKGGMVPQDVIPLSGYNVSTQGVLPRNDIPPAGYDISTEEVLPRAAAPSAVATREGDTAGRTCLENIYNNKLEIDLENTLQTGANLLSSPTPGPEETVLINNFTGSLGGRDSVEPNGNLGGRESLEPKYPTLLIKAKSRHSLAKGQRPTREDLAFPNVAAAACWAVRCWQLAIVGDVSEEETPVMLGKLEELETALCWLRERALREKQLTFTQVLDAYLREDEQLQTALQTAPSPLARLVEFLAAAREIITLWEDAPSEEEMAQLRGLLSEP